LTIVGGGVIGMEFASFFTSLGVQVTVVEMLDEILGGMDKELSAMLRHTNMSILTVRDRLLHLLAVVHSLVAAWVDLRVLLQPVMTR
jgi:heterodisulfide reductase subunit A-like polyferredoxin